MKRKDDFVLRNVGGTSLLVPLGAQVRSTNAIVALNETGRYVWTLLQEDKSIDDLADAVVSRFDVDRYQACSDVRYFLEELTDAGFLA
ncbi:MAG: PqqD family protein [Syntrophus sp. (in: bacteria)]|nr:PqqD family protein [Syntrophus sp. (in: bacteria)]